MAEKRKSEHGGRKAGQTPEGVVVPWAGSGNRGLRVTELAGSGQPPAALQQ